VITNLIGTSGFVTADDVRMLARRGHIVGSHSCSHPDRMWSLSDTDLEHEWRDSVQILTDLIGQPVDTASVPGGFYSRRVGEAAVRAGIKHLFTSSPTATTKRLGDGTVLGRYSVHRDTDVSRLASLAGGKVAGPRRQQAILWEVKNIAKALGGDRYEALRKVFLKFTMGVKRFKSQSTYN
jgi:peptidoglycan/xylan/chitin deacetylase (PgdA/CDA1 family)